MMQSHSEQMSIDIDPILEVQVIRAGRCARHKDLAEPVPCSDCAKTIEYREPVQVYTGQTVKRSWWQRLFG